MKEKASYITQHGTVTFQIGITVFVGEHLMNKNVQRAESGRQEVLKLFERVILILLTSIHHTLGSGNGSRSAIIKVGHRRIRLNDCLAFRVWQEFCVMDRSIQFHEIHKSIRRRPVVMRASAKGMKR